MGASMAREEKVSALPAPNTLAEPERTGCQKIPLHGRTFRNRGAS